MAYDFYLDKCLLPIAPGKLEIKINGDNETITTINEGEINILKAASLTDVEFEVLIPQVKYPFAAYKNDFQPASYFLDYFEQLKTSKKPFQFIVSRTMPNGKVLFTTNMKVSLEDYKITEDAGNGFDIKVKISLKQYRSYGTKTIKVKFPEPDPEPETPKPAENKKPEATPEPKRPVEKSPSKTYKVGDIVNFHGGTHYVSSWKGSQGYPARAGKARIFLGPDCKGNGGAHPYSLIHTDSTSNVYGWVDKGTFD